MSNQPACLSGRELQRCYTDGGNQVEVLRGINLDIYPGERVAVVGSSGSGKSTLLNILSGLDRPTGGEVWLAGQSLNGLSENQLAKMRNQHLGFVYQFHHLLTEFSALENVAMPLLMRNDSLEDVTERAESILKRVGLGHRLSHKPAQLSGGERQRVAIARALVSEPGIVLMDEPTGNLDRHTGEDIQELMRELNQQLKTAFVIVTHDMQLASTMDRMLQMDDGLLTEKTT